MPITFFWITLFVMAIGVPVVFALAIGPLVGFLLSGNFSFLPMVPQRIFGGVNQFPLLAIPLFILAGEIMNSGGITRSLLAFANSLVGHLQGGLAHVNILTSMLFAGISGSAVADTSAIGSILIPVMEEDGYSRKFATAVTAASSVIGPIIPPSIIMIIYAYIMNISVGALFIAGVVPGFLLGVMLMIMASVISKRRNYPKAHRRATIGEIGHKGLSAFFPLLTPVIIIGGILSGVFTPTESAAAAVAYALILSLFVLRTIRLKDLPDIFFRSGMTAATVLILIGAASLFGWAATISGMPQKLASVVTDLSSNPFVLLILINLLLFVVGMFLDAIPVILILGPVLAPTVVAAGIDPLHFAIIMVINVTIGLVTPPMGLILFVASGLTNLSVGVIAKEMLPFLAVHITIVFLVTFLPAITLTLPTILGFH